MSTTLTWSAPLPTLFRAGDMRAFHQRDPQAIAERVTDTSIQKGIIWNNLPACLSIDIQPGVITGQLDIDGEASSSCQPAFKAMVYRMCGLNQLIEQFELQYCNHPQLSALITRQSGLRIPATSTPFEALTWAITGQQISVSAAVSIRRKLISTVNIRHSSGLLCHPEAHHLLKLTETDLRHAGFSSNKANTLLTLAKLVVDNQLPLAEWVNTLPMPIHEITDQLLAIRGIGLWTVNYTLLRGFGWLDGSLHGDVAVRRGLQNILDSPEKISEESAKKWLIEFSPWRSLVAAHLWAMQSDSSY